MNIGVIWFATKKDQGKFLESQKSVERFKLPWVVANDLDEPLTAVHSIDTKYKHKCNRKDLNEFFFTLSCAVDFLSCDYLLKIDCDTMMVSMNEIRKAVDDNIALLGGFNHVSPLMGCATLYKRQLVKRFPILLNSNATSLWPNILEDDRASWCLTKCSQFADRVREIPTTQDSAFLKGWHYDAKDEDLTDYQKYDFVTFNNSHLIKPNSTTVESTMKQFNTILQNG